MTVKISIIIVTYNSAREIPECLSSIFKSNSEIPAEVIIVDNASTDGVLEVVERSFPNVRILSQKTNLGFARANNVGISTSGGEFIFLLNPDVILQERSIHELVLALKANPEAGAVGPRAYWDRERRFLISSLKIPTPLQSWLMHSTLSRSPLSNILFKSHWRMDWMYWTSGPSPFDVPAIGGAYTMIRRKALDSVGGGLDPDYFLGYEDVDLSLRLRRKGWRLLAVPKSEIVHLYGASKRKAGSAINRLLAWDSGPAIFHLKNSNRLQTKCINFMLALEEYLKKHVKSGGSELSILPGQASACEFEWLSDDRCGSYLIELATSPSFFDKFGFITSSHRFMLQPEQKNQMAMGRYYYRVIQHPFSVESILSTGEVGIF